MYQPFTGSFLSMIADSAICDEYYRVCDVHRTDPTEPVKINARAILKAASERINLRKLEGPGVSYEVGGLPEAAELRFILQKAGSIETFFSVRYGDAIQSGRFPILCNMALSSEGRPVPNPPYPKPVYASIEELIVVFQELLALMRTLIELCEKLHDVPRCS